MQTQSTEPDSRAMVASDLSERQRSTALVVFIVAVVALLGLGFGLDRLTTQTSHVVVVPAAVPFPRTMTDAFAKHPGPGLGLAPTGERWSAARGVWAASDGTAGPVAMAPLGSAVALLRVGRGPGSIAVTAQTMTKGMGLAFRCQGLLACWTVTAVPELGTWKITKIVAAVPTEAGNVGTVPVAAGTRIRIANRADGFDVFINEVLARTVTDKTGNDAPLAGLVVDPEPGATTARFAAFAAEQVNVVGSDAPLADGFDRAPGDALGSAPAGQRWKTESGLWGIRAKEAVLRSPPSAEPSVATVDVGRSQGWIQVTGTTVPDGFGAVFRYQDAKNYWRIVAVPGYATFNVFKVINGVDTRVGGTGLTNYANDVTIGIRLRKDEMTFFIDGFETVTMRSTELQRAHRGGLVVASLKGKDARFAGFAAGPLTIAGVQP